jgi:type II secretory pathway pseudopilin PulG
MIKKCGMLNAECGSNAAASTCARSPLSIQHSTFSIRSSRLGLTLIELLVTIVIMVTVLAGVLPLVSPNNNSRKIREASRQLNTLLAQAQAHAARDGRPVGVAFRESGVPGSLSGMALEAYLIAEPPPFAGFSEYSRVTVMDDPDGLTYGSEGTGNQTGNGGELFEATLRGRKLWNLQFTLYGQEDPVPPRMIRIGDALEVAGNYFIVIDDPDADSKPNQVDPDTGYVVPAVELRAVWLNSNGQQLSPGPKPYSFQRQPINTADQALQFPRGIGIDLEASGADGFGVPNSLDNFGATTIGVMFSPNGSLRALYRNDARMDGVEQVYLLLGLAENGNGSALDTADYDFKGNPAADDADLAARRGRVNWLNPDSRWVSVNRAGRIITAENNVSFDPRLSPYIDVNGTTQEQLDQQQANQLNGVAGSPGARQLAKNMGSSAAY